ncbi:MAG: hypothetical protein RRZ73_03735 [Oscillospiraceae bacterium]
MALIKMYGITVLPSMVVMPSATVDCKDGKIITTGNVVSKAIMSPDDWKLHLEQIMEKFGKELSLIYSRQFAENPHKFLEEHPEFRKNNAD